MTRDTDRSIEGNHAGSVHGVWTGTLRELVAYRYVGCNSVVLDRDHAEGWTPMRSHLHGRASVLGAPLAISMLDTAGINIDRLYHLGLTQIDIQICAPALDVARIHTLGSVVREARTQLFTECRFEDADSPGRIIGVGAANWTIIDVTPEGFEYTDPGPGYPEGPGVPSMAEAFELKPLPGGGFRLPGLSPRVGTEILHHGPILVGCEQSALQAAAAATGSEEWVLSSWSVRIVRGGRRKPFDFSAQALAATPEGVLCRSLLKDAAGDTLAVSHSSYRAGG